MRITLIVYSCRNYMPSKGPTVLPPMETGKISYITIKLYDKLHMNMNMKYMNTNMNNEV